MHDPRLITSRRGVRRDSVPSNSNATRVISTQLNADTGLNARVPRRRNGLQPACEPCRKAKVRCDNIPSESICARCRKRKSPSLCIFLDAPMSGSQKGGAHNTLELDIPKQAPTPATSVSTKIHSPTCISEPAQRAPDSAGFFGSTSFSATMEQTNMATDPPLAGGELASIDNESDQDPAKLSLGVRVLSLLPDERTSSIFLNWYLSNSAEVGFHKPSIVHCFESIWSTYGESLQLPRRQDGLERMAREIFRNGNVELKLSDDTAEWMESYSGSNTRWETVGILFIAFGYGVLSLPEIQLSPIIKAAAKKDRKAFLTEIKECVEICVSLCRHSLNNIVCNLLYKNLLFETILYGDSSLSVWRLHHDLVAVSSAIGLHCYQGGPQVTVVGEMSKRLSACVFWSDKEIAMFTGRPPALSHRYYSSPLPLDLSDEALMIGGDRLDEEVRSLDANGWNTMGKINDATLCRMMVSWALIQDELMEMFLGTSSQWSTERVDALKARTHDTYSQFPIDLQVSKDDLANCSSDSVMWRLLFCRFDYLRIQFLLERLSAERGKGSKKKLLDVAREMVDLTVFVWLQRDRTINRQHDYDYMIMCYGMPSIGILCVELLKQVKQPKNVETKLPVSEVVQNLSMMIGFLEWVRPTAGNYKLCRRMSRVIRRVLDQVFEPQQEEAPQEDQSGPVVDMWPIEDFDDFDWLNSIDWSKGPYTEANWA